MSWPVLGRGDGGCDDAAWGGWSIESDPTLVKEEVSCSSSLGLGGVRLDGDSEGGRSKDGGTCVLKRG